MRCEHDGRMSPSFLHSSSSTTQIYTLSLHDALPISDTLPAGPVTLSLLNRGTVRHELILLLLNEGRSEEHTSELQSLAYLVCRLLLEKKKTRPASSLPRR